jgi:hypothetical protein
LARTGASRPFFPMKLCIESSGFARDSMDEQSAKSRFSLFAVTILGQ